MEYVNANGTSYNVATKEEIINVLEKARTSRSRIVFELGNPETGESWGEHFDCEGYVDRSTGRVQIPICVHNSRSLGGFGILTDKIVGVWSANGKEELYLHPTYTPNKNGRGWLFDRYAKEK